jgi:dynein heavy chain
VTETYLVGTTVVGGHLCDSKLKELLPRLPVVYVKAVPVQPTWEPSAVGYLRHQDDLYEAPVRFIVLDCFMTMVGRDAYSCVCMCMVVQVYITSFRGPTYVFLATLKSADATSKWVLTGTAVLMQTDD